MSPANIRNDLVVHGLDIAVPLGINRVIPEATGVAVFENLWNAGAPFRARKRFAGVRLVATDADLAVGEGPEVTGRLADLLLAITGRPAGLERLSGAVSRVGAQR